MTFDREAFVARYVEAGGTEADGRATANKMAQAQGQHNAASGLLHLPRNAQALGFTPQTTAAPPVPQAAVNASLFDETETPPSPAQPPTPPSSRRLPVPTTRRGRKPTAFDAPREPSQHELDLFKMSLQIEENGHAFEDRGYLTTGLVFASMPHSEVEGAIFKRKNGFVSFSIMNDPDIGLPYGKIPRLITAFLCTEAKRYSESRGREIHLGRSQSDFLAKLGLSSTGGENGNIARARDQARRLFTSTITLIGEPGHEFHFDSMRLGRKGHMLWNPHKPEERGPWQSKLILTEEFFEQCLHHNVPINLQVLHKLRSPFAIDLYVWLTYRYHSITVPTPIPWQALQWQFGANYPATPQGLRDFKNNFKRHLRSVWAIYRDAKFQVEQDHFILLPSKPHILPES